MSKRYDEGFTLVELLVATAVLGIVMSLLVAVMMQVSQVTTESTDRMAVLGDISLAAQSLGFDVNSAAVAVIADPYHMTLQQPDPVLGDRTVVYTVAPPLLLRDEGGLAQPVARHITAETGFGPFGTTSGGRTIAVHLVARQAGQSQLADLQLSLRAEP